MQVPAVREFRAAAHLRFDAAVAGLQRERVEAAVNAQVAVAGVGVERAVEIVSFDVSIAGVDAYVALDDAGRHVAVARIELNFAGDADRGHIAVTGPHVQIQIARHADFDAQRAMSAAEERKIPVRHLYFNRNAVAGLALYDLYVIGSDLPAVGGDVRVNLMLVRAGDGDVAVAGGYVQVRAPVHLISLRPLVCPDQRSQGARRDSRNDHGRSQNCRPPHQWICHSIHRSLRRTITLAFSRRYESSNKNVP